MMFSVDSACLSDRGKIRAENEDNFLFGGKVRSDDVPIHYEAPAENTCFAVFDGMGGAEHGEIASLEAAGKMASLMKAAGRFHDPMSMMEQAALMMNRSVSDKRAELGAGQMGTTAAAVYFRNGLVYGCNVGDSRIYRLRGGNTDMLSIDHTNAERLKARGIKGRSPTLTQYIGMDPEKVMIEPHTFAEPAEAGDIFLLCTDGLTDMVNEERIADILGGDDSPSGKASALMNEALQNGGRDNITVIVIVVK